MKPGVDALLLPWQLKQQVAALLAQIEALVPGDKRLLALFREGLKQRPREFCRTAPRTLLAVTDVHNQLAGGFFMRFVHSFTLSPVPTPPCRT